MKDRTGEVWEGGVDDVVYLVVSPGELESLGWIRHRALALDGPTRGEMGSLYENPPGSLDASSWRRLA